MIQPNPPPRSFIVPAITQKRIKSLVTPESWIFLRKSWKRYWKTSSTMWKLSLAILKRLWLINFCYRVSSSYCKIPSAIFYHLSLAFSSVLHKEAAKDAVQDPIHITSYNYHVIRELINYMYNYYVNLNEENVKELLFAAIDVSRSKFHLNQFLKFLFPSVSSR